MVNRDLKDSSRSQHPSHLGQNGAHVRDVMDYTETVHAIEVGVRKWQACRVRLPQIDGETFQLEIVSSELQMLVGDVDAETARSGPGELLQISAKSNANLQHPSAVEGGIVEELALPVLLRV